MESSEELQHVVNRCLAKKPDERYQTTKDLLSEIRRIKRDTESGARAVAAAPPRLRYLGALITSLLVVTGLVALWRRAPKRFLPRVGRTIQVTREPGLEIDATLSPDGKLVAYALGPLGATKIYVKQVAGRRPVPLTEDLNRAHRFPRWSPDGTRISFQSERLDGTDMYIIPALGGAPRRLPTHDALEWVWSPNGEQIAYATDSAIFAGPAETGEARKLSDAYQPSSLSWSPDGKRIAFTSGNSHYLFLLLNAAPSSIYVVDVTSGEPVRLMEEDAYLDFSPVWTPDGKSLLFVSDRGGGRDIYRISVGPTGGTAEEPERLTTGPNVFTLASSSNGLLLNTDYRVNRKAPLD